MLLIYLLVGYWLERQGNERQSASIKRHAVQVCQIVEGDRLLMRPKIFSLAHRHSILVPCLSHQKWSTFVSFAYDISSLPGCVKSLHESFNGLCSTENRLIIDYKERNPGDTGARELQSLLIDTVCVIFVAQVGLNFFGVETRLFARKS